MRSGISFYLMPSCLIQRARCNEPPQYKTSLGYFFYRRQVCPAREWLFEKATGMYGCSLRKALLELLKSTATYALVFSHTIYSIREKLELGVSEQPLILHAVMSRIPAADGQRLAWPNIQSSMHLPHCLEMRPN